MDWQKNKFKITFDKVSLKLAINFILDYCFFNFDILSFRQIIGIPMDSDTALFMTNLFLYYYQSKWLLDTKKEKIYVNHAFLVTWFLL